jgi:hypothetical protein
MLKYAFWFFIFLIVASTLTSCNTVNSTVPPTQIIQLSSPTIRQISVTTAPSSTATPAVTDMSALSSTPLATGNNIPSVTPRPTDTLDPEQVKETVQSLLDEPMNCLLPCFWGITPGKTRLDEARTLFTQLGYAPFEGTDRSTGKDFLTIEYKLDSDRDHSHVSLLGKDNLVENIVITPQIESTREDGQRDWLAYSPETLIKRFGTPKVELKFDRGPNYVIEMTMYFDAYNLVVNYSGYNLIPDRPQSPRLCPLTAPFDSVRLWMGKNPPNLPVEGVMLEKATSLSIDQFTELMLGDPEKACFVVNGDMFQ